MTPLTSPADTARRLRQLAAVTRLELRKCLRGRRLIGLGLLNLIPVALLVLTYLLPPEEELLRKVNPTGLSEIFAVMFATFMTRIGIFFTAAFLALHLFRTEMLEKTLHYYLLAPVHRQIVVVGKYFSASLTSSLICGISTAAAYLLTFGWLGGGLGRFFFDGPGLSHLLTYLTVVALGCFGYGAVFALFGLLWRQSIIPVLMLFIWESVLFLLPSSLKLFSVLYYLESLLPYRAPVGPLAVLADPPPAFLSIGGVLVFSILVLLLAGWRARRLEISYGTD